MTALRAVRPNRACDARSSSPMYASTSTIRPDAGGPASRRRGRAARRGAPARPRASAGRGAPRSVAQDVGDRRPGRDVERLDVVRDEEPEDRDRSPGSAASGTARPSPSRCRSRRSRAGTAARRPTSARRGIRKYESRITMMQPSRNSALDDAEDAAEDLVDERVLLEQRLLVVEALDDQREGDRRGDEHDPEPEHDRVLVRELVPVRRRGRGRPTLAEVGREEEREEHRRRARAAGGSSPA